MAEPRPPAHRTRPRAPTPAVSVVIPAYNAALLIGETLRSVQRQTVADIEILVVDDGSTDATSQIIAQAAAEDQRIRLIRTENRGVAAARNRGLEEARAEFVAPVDADDLWHAEKLERQLEAFRRGGPALGFVYCFRRLIDARGNVEKTPPAVVQRGQVFREHLMLNAVGNGSAMLMRKEAVRAVGGYEPRLRELGWQGCEDYHLQLRLAHSYEIGVAPYYLVGYRKHAEGMSADAARMLRARIVMLGVLERQLPSAARDIRKAIARAKLRLAITLADSGDPIAALYSFAAAAGQSPSSALRGLAAHAAWTFRRRRGADGSSPLPRMPFAAYPAEAGEPKLAADTQGRPGSVLGTDAGILTAGSATSA